MGLMTEEEVCAVPLSQLNRSYRRDLGEKILRSRRRPRLTLVL